MEGGRTWQAGRRTMDGGQIRKDRWILHGQTWMWIDKRIGWIGERRNRVSLANVKIGWMGMRGWRDAWMNGYKDVYAWSMGKGGWQ